MSEGIILRVQVEKDDLAHPEKIRLLCARVIYQAKVAGETLVVLVRTSATQVKVFETIMGLFYGCARVAKFNGNTEVYFEGYWDEAGVKKEFGELQEAIEPESLKDTSENFKAELNKFIQDTTEDASLIPEDIQVKQSKRACIGGTFDNIHFGHKVLLNSNSDFPEHRRPSHPFTACGCNTRLHASEKEIR